MMGITVHDSTKMGKYIFELDSSVDGDNCRAHTNKYVGKEPQGTSVPVVEIGRKIKLLQQNEEQRRLHEQLVMGNIIIEDEFWVKRKKLLQAVACEPTNQQTGLKSAMISYMQLMSGDQTNKVQMNSEIILQIFTEKPAVLREFLTKVPDQIKETEFWSKFFTAESYRQKEKIALGRAEAHADKQLAIFLEDDDIVADEVQHKIANVNPAIDMIADYSDDYTHLQGHGILGHRNDNNVLVVTDKLQEALLHDINRHAIIVLEGRAIDSKLQNATEIAKALEKIQKGKRKIQIVDERLEKHRLQKVNKMVEIDDLQIPLNLYVPLSVKGPGQYSNSQEANALDVRGGNMEVNFENVYTDIQERSLKIKKKGLDSPIIKSDLTLKVMTTMDQCSSKSQISHNLKTNIMESLPHEINKNILEHLEIILELLWHFWASYPPTNELASYKVNQLKEEITQRYKRLQEIMKPLQSDVRHGVASLVQPMLQAIGVATTH